MELLSAILSDAKFDWESFLPIAGGFVAAALIIGFLARSIFGSRSNVSHGVSSAVGILFIYIATFVILTSGGELAELKAYLSPLPFVNFNDKTITVFSFAENAYPVVCSQLLGMIILAFLVNLLDSLLPRGDHVISWFLFRCMTIVLAMAGHWAITTAAGSILPEIIVANAPVILLWLLIIMLAVGALRFVVGAALATVNPVIGILYTFFFSSFVGKHLSKAVLTTCLLSGLVWMLNTFGITSLTLNAASMQAYLPYLGVLALVWYALNHLL